MRNPLGYARDGGRWLASEGPLVLAFFVFSIGVLILAIGTLVDERNEANRSDEFQHRVDILEYEAQCRFALSAPVQRIQADKQNALALGLVAVAEGDEVALREQTAIIRSLSAREQDALDLRETAAEECNARAERIFG